MAQKVQFIATVVARPELVLLDEPFSGLDPVNAEVLREADPRACKRDGTTVIFSTHDMAVAEKMCDFIFMIYKGRKVLDGTLDAIQDAYGSDTVRVRLDGDGGRLDGLPGVVAGHRLRPLPGAAAGPRRRPAARAGRADGAAAGCGTSSWPGRRCTTSSSASPAPRPEEADHA